MFVAERFLLTLLKEYGKHPVEIDGGTWYTASLQFLETKTPYAFYI